MSRVRNPLASSAVGVVRQRNAIKQERRHTNPNSRSVPGDRSGTKINTSSAYGSDRGCAPVSDSVTCRQKRKVNAFSPDSEGHRVCLPEVRPEEWVFQYQHKGDPLGQEQIEVIAQNLLKDLPDTVERDPLSGLLSVKLDKLLAYTLEGVPEAGRALKELNAKQPLGLLILMRQQSAMPSPYSGINSATLYILRLIIAQTQTPMTGRSCQPTSHSVLRHGMHP